MSLYLLCLLLFCLGIYCTLRKRNIIKIIIGIIIAEYAVNLFFVLVAYRMYGRAPIFSQEADITNMVDPLPHALVLTAIATEQPALPRLAVAREAWGVMLRDPLLRTAAPQRYWEARYHYLEIMLREGKAAEVESAIRQDRVWYPDRDQTEWDEKLNELYEQAVAQLGET